MRPKKAILFLCALILTFASGPAFAISLPAGPKPGDQTEVDITWSRTTEPQGYISLPVAQWVWSDVDSLNYNRTYDVWDGGAIGNNYIKNARRPWDIATWHTNRSSWNGYCDVRRFHGEFTIPDGYDVYDYVMLSSVGDYQALGLGDIVAINDNIYIFIYPKGQQINNSNFMDYFAFWTGTAGQEAAKQFNGGNPIAFHGNLGTPPHDYKVELGIAGTNTRIPPENLLSHTDGWYCEAVQDNIGHTMHKSPEATEFIIDLFVEDFAEDGGMDRLNLTFTRVGAEVLPPETTIEPLTETPEPPTDTPAPLTETPEPPTETHEILPPLIIMSETPEPPLETETPEVLPPLIITSEPPAEPPKPPPLDTETPELLPPLITETESPPPTKETMETQPPPAETQEPLTVEGNSDNPKTGAADVFLNAVLLVAFCSVLIVVLIRNR